ncbi:hypothetical protein pzkkv23_81 [Klebsiella phage pzk-kv23]|nr:hypothetical protein pzkkv23_81 [Klebsiella phage pzk-kv23]
MFHMKSCVPGINCTVEAEEGLYLEGGRIESQEVAAVLKCDTNVCGTSWTDLHFLGRGIDVDSLSWEKACDHAESMLGEDDWEEDDGDEKYANAGVEGSFYMYWPGHSCNLVNGGSPLHSVLERAIYLGYIQIVDGKAVINLRELKTFIYIPDAETILRVEEGLKSGWKVSGVVYL